MDPGELASIPLIDAHCHGFDIAAAAADLSNHLTLSTEPLGPGLVESTLLYRRVVVELAGFLGCDPTAEAVTAVRRQRFETGAAGYVRSLFADSNIETLLVDDGFPTRADYGPLVEPEAFAAMTGRPCRRIVRIETLAQRLLLDESPFDTFAERFERSIRTAMAGGAVAMKSEIAYYTGLDIEPPTRSSARRAYEDTRSGRVPFGRGKAFGDFLFVTALEIGRDLGVPLQVHAGMGDGPEFDMTTARPVLLRRLLFDPTLRRSTIVLTHAGYPWVEESGWLANQYDNIYIDISEMVPFASSGVAGKLASLLEMAPTTKLMYGSDGLNAPELHWIAARIARQALADALDHLVRTGWVQASEAAQIAMAVLHDNAVRLYHL